MEECLHRGCGMGICDFLSRIIMILIINIELQGQSSHSYESDCHKSGSLNCKSHPSYGSQILLYIMLGQLGVLRMMTPALEGASTILPGTYRQAS